MDYDHIIYAACAADWTDEGIDPTPAESDLLHCPHCWQQFPSGEIECAYCGIELDADEG